jgi:acyl-CoA reductase-like NAD-dependent aldehyde dehydrogenase
MDNTLQVLCERDHHYIDGRWVSGTGDRITLVDPYTEQPFGHAPAGDAALVDQAVASAQQAQAGWAATPAAERAAWLGRWLQALHPQAETIAQLISREMGAPIARARLAQAGGGLMALQGFTQMAHHVQRVERIANSVVVREAAGVAGLITAWNYPFFLAIGKAAPALLAGCTVVLKPSDFTPLSLYVMADAAHRIGLPPGVFNLVHGTGPVIGEAISGHAGIDVVSYTGSIPIGKRVMERAARNVKRVALELGGKSAAIVLPGADLRGAVEKTAADCFNNSGQTCIAITRLLVPEGQLQQAAEMAATHAAAFRAGDPRDAATTLGPIATRRHQQQVLAYIRSGMEQGAQLVCGGDAPVPGMTRGWFVQPTVFATLDPSLRIAQEEIFGPVLTVIGYRDVDHAVEIANGTVHGLNGGVYGTSDDEATAIAARMRCGKVDINGGAFNINAPAGGYKQSGIGRERGHHAIDEYQEIKAMQFVSEDAARALAERLSA